MSEEYAWKTCPVCGIHYAAPAAFFEARNQGRNVPKEWYCPNGHQLVFTESEVDRICRERDRLAQENARLADQAAAERRRREQAEKETARVRRRAVNAVCPCCHRSFANVARHMRTKHPEVTPIAAKAEGGR